MLPTGLSPSPFPWFPLAWHSCLCVFPAFLGTGSAEAWQGQSPATPLEFWHIALQKHRAQARESGAAETHKQKAFTGKEMGKYRSRILTCSPLVGSLGSSSYCTKPLFGVGAPRASSPQMQAVLHPSVGTLLLCFVKRCRLGKNPVFVYSVFEAVDSSPAPRGSLAGQSLVAVPALASLVRLQVAGSRAGPELGPRSAVLWAEGHRATWHLGSWLWWPPRQRAVLMSAPHGGVTGRAWTFPRLRSAWQRQQAVSSSSSTVAGGGREKQRAREARAGCGGEHTHPT